jgi:molecular chaperone GrpE
LTAVAPDGQPAIDEHPGPVEAGQVSPVGDERDERDERDDRSDERAQRTAELEDRLRRALADLDNMRKRFEREVWRERAAERTRVVNELLPVVDNLERALAHAGATAETLVSGTRAVLDQATAALTRLGFPRFDDVGRPFDPARHEAVGTVEADAPAGTVVATVRPGYGTEEELLRPAAVVVAKGPG